MNEAESSASDDPKENKEASPETGDAENITDEQEIQFRCKLCHYTGKDKEEIASHFLSKHIAVEVRSIGRDDSNRGADGGFVEVTGSKKPNARKRGRPRREVKLKEEEEEEDDDEDDESGKAFVHKPSQISISSRGRRRKIPFKFAVDADDDGSHPYLSSSRSSRRGKGPRKGRMNKNWRLLGEDETFYKRHSLTVTPAEFEYQLLKLVEEWEQTWFQQKSTEDVRCKHTGCKCQLDEEEMSLHLRCHQPFLEGFQCPLCEFVCVHWRNMRHHFYKEHQQKGKTLSCNLPLCDAVFERFGELKRHVSTTHLKARLVEQLTKPSTESEEPSVSEEARTVKIEPNVEPNVEVSEDKEPEESSNGTLDLTENTEPPNEDSAMETDAKDDEATEKVSDYVEIEMDGDEDYPEVKCEIESTKKRITKKRKSATDNDVGYDVSGEKKKRHYVKSGEFSGNMADRQRALVAYACDLCGAKYNDLDDLEKHRGSHEEIDDEDGSTVMKCTECDGKFITSELLEEHVKQKHKRLLKLHRCHLCQFSSERRFDLKKHLVIHTGIKNYMCDQCGKCMSTPYNLKIHYLRLHATEEEKNITCSEDDCDFKCADKAVLKDHLRQKHNLMIDNRDSEKVEKIKLFSCKHCDYTGKKESSLRYHMRIHLENRQHKCKLCPYASKTKNNLILHMRTHDGMQPVKCSQCDFRGATNKIISEHILSKHAGIRPYRCLVCKWSTSYSGNMWKHIHDHRSELGDAMPAEPVEVVTGEGVAIPVPLRPPSGRKRTKLHPPRQYSRSPAADNLKAISKEFQAAHTARVDALSQLLQVNASGANPEETVTIVEVPIPMGEGESSVIMGGSESATTSALNSLAAAVATAREVALLSQQAQAVISGQQGTDSSNPYPVSQLFQQIAGQASGSQQTQIITSALASSSEGNEVIIAVTSPDSLHQAVLQSGITSSSQPGSVGVTDQTKVTYTIARPQGGGEEEVQFTVQPDIHFENQSAVADIPDPEESHVESDHVYVSINESDLHVSEDDRHGHTLQIVESSAVKDHVSCEQNTEVEEHNVSQLVTMIPEGELVMSMVPSASQSNPNYVSDSQQPVEAHIVVSDPENPGQYIQQEIHYVQTNENGEAILEQNGTTQVVHIVQQENGELAYQDSNGQVYTAENTQVMFQPAEQSEQDFIPNEIPEAITISDTDGRLGIPDSEQLVSSEGHLGGVTEGVDQQEVQIAVAAEFIDQDHEAVDHIGEDQLNEGKNEQSHENIEAMPEDLTTTCTGESDNSKVLSTASLEERQDEEDLKTSSIEEPVENEDLPPDEVSDVHAQSEK